MQSSATFLGLESPETRAPTTYGAVKAERAESWVHTYSGPLPQELLSQCSWTHCGPCGINFNSPIVSRTHYLGRNHEKRVAGWLEHWSNRTKQKPPVKLERYTQAESVDVRRSSITFHLINRQLTNCHQMSAAFEIFSWNTILRRKMSGIATFVGLIWAPRLWPSPTTRERSTPSRRIARRLGWWSRAITKSKKIPLGGLDSERPSSRPKKRQVLYLNRPWPISRVWVFCFKVAPCLPF